MILTAKQTGSNYAFTCPPIFQRKRTYECECDALNMLEAYRDFNKITSEEYKIARNEIIVAPHDDAISDILCKIRHRVKW